MKKVAFTAAAILLSTGLAFAQTPSGSGSSPAQSGAPASTNPNAPPTPPAGSGTQGSVPGSTAPAATPSTSGATPPPAPADRGTRPSNTPGG